VQRILNHRRSEMSLRLGTAAAEAARQLEKQNILLSHWAVHPGAEPPDLPHDIPGMTDREVMELFRAYNQWARYLALQLAAAQVDEEYAEQKLVKLTALAQIKNRAEKNVTTMKALANDDPTVRTAEDEKLEAYSYRKMIEALHHTVDMNYKHTSREISRRCGNGAARDQRAERYME
jgi:hypothetical protein